MVFSHDPNDGPQEKGQGGSGLGRCWCYFVFHWFFWFCGCVAAAGLPRHNIMSMDGGFYFPIFPKIFSRPATYAARATRSAASMKVSGSPRVRASAIASQFASKSATSWPAAESLGEEDGAWRCPAGVVVFFIQTRNHRFAARLATFFTNRPFTLENSLIFASNQPKPCWERGHLVLPYRLALSCWPPTLAGVTLAPVLCPVPTRPRPS